MPAGDPMEAKLALARGIVAPGQGDEAARRGRGALHPGRPGGPRARGRRRAALPAGRPVHLPALLADAFGLSTSEGRRLIAQGGVKVDGRPAEALDLPRESLEGAVVQAGKRRFVRLVSA